MSWSGSRAARTLAAQVDEQALAELLDRLMGDPFPPLRRLAFKICEESATHRLEAFARAGLFDRSAALRESCQETLVMRFDVEPSMIYRDAPFESFSPSRLASTLLGLAETGGVEDLPVFQAYCDSRYACVRAAAVFGLGRLAQDGEASQFFHRLRDPSPRVVRVARAVLKRIAWNPGLLREAFRATETTAVRKELVKLGFRLSLWDRILFLLEALDGTGSESDEVVCDQLRGMMAKMRGVTSSPSVGERERIEELLRLREGVLEVGLVERLRWMLRFS